MFEGFLLGLMGIYGVGMLLLGYELGRRAVRRHIPEPPRAATPERDQTRGGSGPSPSRPLADSINDAGAQQRVLDAIARAQH